MRSGFTGYFIKRGEKKAKVKVIFVDKENKEYIVERKISVNSNNSWIVKDIENEEEIVSGDIDVTNWLKDHLGFYKDDKISEIYENIISVPQGMFTSAFLDSPQNRKSKFDPIFNLEIYRNVYKNTVGIESGLKDKKTSCEAELGKTNVRIEMLSKDKEEYSKLNRELKDINGIKKDKELEYKSVNELYLKLNSKKNEINKIQENLKIDTIKQENVKKNIEIYNKELEISNKAIEILENNRQGYETYIKEEEKKNNLKLKKQEFDKLIEQKKELNKEIESNNTVIVLKNESKVEIKSQMKKLDIEIADLEEQIKQEEKNLAEKLVKLEEEKRECDELKLTETEVNEALKEFEKNKIVINSYEENKKKKIEQIGEEEVLVKKRQSLEKQISFKEEVAEKKNKVDEKVSELNAKLKYLEESKKIAKSGLCPYLKSECINVKGKTEKEYDEEIETLNLEIKKSKSEISNLKKDEKEIIDAEVELKGVIKQLENIMNEKEEIKKIQRDIKNIEGNNDELKNKILKILEKNNISQSLENVQELNLLYTKRQNDFNENDKSYNVLKTKLDGVKKEKDNKLGEIKKNKDNLKKIEEDLEEKSKKINECKLSIKKIEEDLKKYESIEKEIEENEKVIKETKAQYDIYMQNKEIAKRADKIRKDISEAEVEINEIQRKLEENTKALAELNSDYNDREFEELEKNKNELSIQIAELNMKIETKKQRIDILKKNIEDLKLAKEMSKELTKKINTYKKVIDYVMKIRTIINQAPQDISKILIQNVAKKATEMYSKIANDNTKLEWREGYEVILLDNIDGQIIEKEFKQLSGGEQMSVALAIRMSMLEILTNLQIGILDEPTVNMDSGRRQRLAEIIESIGGGFKQLFVVSHDDTFNSITEHIINVTRIIA